MTIDITNPEHRKIMLCICDELIESTTRNERLDRATFAMPFGALGGEIFDTLSDPAKAAELIRQLVERAGARVDVECVRQVQWRIAYWVGNERAWFAVNFPAGGVIPRTTSIIARLLALAPNAGADAVLAALRGES